MSWQIFDIKDAPEGVVWLAGTHPKLGDEEVSEPFVLLAHINLFDDGDIHEIRPSEWDLDGVLDHRDYYNITHWCKIEKPTSPLGRTDS